MCITKAVIPCGGLGTRFLPITKAIPKEILPIIDVPTIALIVDEAVKSGIFDVLIILGNGKESIKNYFMRDAMLEDALMRSGKSELCQQLINITQQANISFTYQQKPLGSGDALLKAQFFTGNEPFCLALGDDLVQSKVPVMAQMSTAFKETSAPLVGVQFLRGDDITKYGVAVLSGNDEGRLHRCSGFKEKPPLDKLPSRYAAMGRYVLTADIYDELLHTKTGLNGELQLTDAINTLCGRRDVYAFEFEGKRHDAGDKLGYIKAIIEYGLEREFGASLREYIKALGEVL